jgi:hypothetical protein
MMPEVQQRLVAALAGRYVAGRIVLEVWVAEPGNRGHARRRFSAAQAYCTGSGREALELIGT